MKSTTSLKARGVEGPLGELLRGCDFMCVCVFVVFFAEKETADLCGRVGFALVYACLCFVFFCESVRPASRGI